MRFLIDEDVPLAVAEYIQRREHEARQSRDDLVRGSYDWVLADYAHANNLIVVTWNHRHFAKLIKRRPQGGQIRYPNAGRISFTCPKPVGVERLSRYMPVIEQEYALVQNDADKRLIVEIRTEDVVIG